MRLSVILTDPGYHPMAGVCEVTLNGHKPIHPVHTADEEAGRVWCHMGYDVERDEIKTLELTGTVEIVIPDEYKADWNNYCAKDAPCTLAQS